MSKRYVIETPDYAVDVVRWRDIEETQITEQFTEADELFTYCTGTQTFFTLVDGEDVSVTDVDTLSMARKIIRAFGYTILEEVGA